MGQALCEDVAMNSLTFTAFHFCHLVSVTIHMEQIVVWYVFCCVHPAESKNKRRFSTAMSMSSKLYIDGFHNSFPLNLRFKWGLLKIALMIHDDTCVCIYIYVCIYIFIYVSINVSDFVEFLDNFCLYMLAWRKYTYNNNFHPSTLQTTNFIRRQLIDHANVCKGGTCSHKKIFPCLIRTWRHTVFKTCLSLVIYCTDADENLEPKCCTKKPILLSITLVEWFFKISM